MSAIASENTEQVSLSKVRSSHVCVVADSNYCHSHVGAAASVAELLDTKG